jgi:hypothetical protein
MNRPRPTPRRESPGERPWLADALRSDVVRRSLRVAAVVGSILIAINYSDRWLAGALTGADWIKMGITYLVPYGVATYAAVAAIRRGG